MTFVLCIYLLILFSVDPQTDRIFKEFLCQTKPANPVVSLPSGESLPPPSHMVPPPPLKQTSSAQLRRQVMRKQYSDSIAMYYGQRQRKWRFSNQVKILFSIIDILHPFFNYLFSNFSACRTHFQ